MAAQVAPARARIAKAPTAPVKAPVKAPAATAVETGETAPKKLAVERTIEEELQMAVEGTLKPRKLLGTADQASLLAKASNGRPVGRPKGLTTGLTIQMVWQYLFQQNEKAPEKPASLDATGIAIAGTGKMTEDQITAYMKREFPGRENNTFNSPSMARRLQNQGQATRGIKPKIQSQAWGADCKPLPARQLGEGLKKANEARAAKKASAAAEPTAADTANEVEEIPEEVEADA